MTCNGVKRLIVESSLSVGSSRADARFGSARLVRLFLGDIMQDKERQEALVRQSTLDWTIVRPARLTDGPRSLRVRTGTSVPWSVLSSVSRADVAAMMLAWLQDPTTFRKSLSIVGEGAR